MGLGDFVSRAVLEFRGDTSDLKAKIKELSGIEKERAQQLLANIERENKGYESIARKLGDLNQALELTGKVTSAIGDAFKEYGEHMRLVTAAGSADIGKLSKAFHGLLNEHELLTFAAQTQNGAFALNQQEMEKVGQAAVALRNRGFDLGEATKKLTDALVKGKTEGLDDFGLSLKDGETKAQSLKNIMAELDRVIKESGGSYNDAADDIQRLSKGWDDATAAAKRYMAQSVMALGKDITHIFGTDEQMRKQEELIRKGMSQQAAYDLVIGEDSARAQATRDNIAEANRARQIQAQAQRRADNAVIEMPEMDVSRKPGSRSSKPADDGIPDWAKNYNPYSGNETAVGDLEKWLTGLTNEDGASRKSALAGIVDQFKAIGEAGGGVVDAVTKIGEAAANVPEQKPLLERLGLHDPTAMDMAGAAVQSFASSYAASMQAIGESSASGEEIFRHATGGVVRAIGGQLAAKGAAEAVEGAALLLTGNPAGAAHLGAAALYSAGAVAAYAAAAKLDPKGGSGGSGGRDHRASASGGASSGGRTSDGSVNSPGSGSHNGGGVVREIHTFTFLDPFSEMDQTARKAYAQRMVDKAVEQASARR